MAVNIKDLYGNLGNRFNNILTENFKKCLTFNYFMYSCFLCVFFPIHCDLSDIFWKLGIKEIA